MKCYLCEYTEHTQQKGSVRDNKNLEIYKCNKCGLVFLNDAKHITDDFYKQGCMEKSCDIGDIYLPGEQTDTQKRYNSYKAMLANKRILDFGCSKGLFLSKLKSENTSNKLNALEPNLCYKDKLSKNFNYYEQIESIPDNSLDFITMFHVLEHLPDPLAILNQLYNKLDKDGKIIIEVPSSNDALLNLYDNDAFANFTYWSCHLYLFNQRTLEDLINKTKFNIKCLKQYQRYTLANHLHWLAKDKPAGHIEWSFLDDEAIQVQYERKLAEIGQCDSIVAIIQK